MSLPTVRVADDADFSTVLSTITLAFATDPLNRWYLPDANRYLTHFPEVVKVFLAASIEAGACYVTERGEGVRARPSGCHRRPHLTKQPWSR